MAPRRIRRIALGAALLFALGATFLAPSEESRPSAPAPAASGAASPASARPAAKAAAVAQLARYERRIDEGPVLDLFEPRRPPPAPPPPPAAKPKAPALPFAYMGMVEDDGKLKVFLVQGDRIHEAVAGAVFTPEYRLDAIEAAGLKITYLPLDEQQVLPTGAVK